jgi:hypothetical protein
VDIHGQLDDRIVAGLSGANCPRIPKMGRQIQESYEETWKQLRGSRHTRPVVRERRGVGSMAYTRYRRSRRSNGKQATIGNRRARWMLGGNPIGSAREDDATEYVAKLGLTPAGQSSS